MRSEEEGELGVRYGTEEGDWLDLYNEKGPGDLVAYFTGGYWQVTPDIYLIRLNAGAENVPIDRPPGFLVPSHGRGTTMRRDLETWWPVSLVDTGRLLSFAEYIC